MRSGCERIALFPFTDAAVYLMPLTAVIPHDMAGQTTSNLGDYDSVIRENRASALSKTGKRFALGIMRSERQKLSIRLSAN